MPKHALHGGVLALAAAFVGGCGGAGAAASADAGADTSIVEAGGLDGPTRTPDADHPVDATARDSSTGDAAAPVEAAVDSGSVPPLPSPLRGVTVDDVSNSTGVVAALAALPHKPVARVVFDETQAPSYYAQPVAAIHGVAYVLGEILDSQYVSATAVSAYSQRTSDYLTALAPHVDLWEVGNEINGNWLGTTADVVAKMSGAFDLVKAAGGRTELTLYGCSDSGAAYDMVSWAQANVPARMLSGLDYVLVSYYEGDCGSPRTDWTTPFQQLRALFPNAGLGFGEVGYVDANGADLALSDETGAAAYVDKYYRMTPPIAGYVGGYFWWYFAEDMVPTTQPLFPVLSAAMQ